MESQFFYSLPVQLAPLSVDHEGIESLVLDLSEDAILGLELLESHFLVNATVLVPFEHLKGLLGQVHTIEHTRRGLAAQPLVSVLELGKAVAENILLHNLGMEGHRLEVVTPLQVLGD